MNVATLLRVAILVALLTTVGCAVQRENPEIAGQDLRVTFLHTADIHARFFPYRMQVMLTDKNLGLLQENEPFGGIARLAHAIEEERARGDRVVLLDSGDCFQGAPVFNAFHGEVAIRTMSQLRPDATVVGNHEFDEGLSNYVEQLDSWSTFPSLAANYLFETWNRLGTLTEPYTIINADGLRIGVIGVANFSSLSSVTDVGNSLGIIPLNIEQTVQDYIDVLRPNVDLVVALSHAGMSKDERMIRCTEGLDIVFGGHLHVALKPPKVLKDAAERDVLLVHSGAFAKYLGKLDVVVRESEKAGRGWEVVQHRYSLRPIDSTVPQEAKMLELLEPYRLQLNQLIDLTSVFAYTPRLLTKYGYSGGDSALGNLVAETLREYARVDIGFTNTLGIRSNIYPGIITADDLYNVFPFNNTITLMYMSGTDIEALLDYVTERSAGRGCVSQLQVAGVEFTMNCNFAPAECRCDVRGPVCPGAIGLEFEGFRGYECYGREDATDRRLTDVCREACDCPEDAVWVSECRCPPKAEDIRVTPCSDPSIVDRTDCDGAPLEKGAIYEVATNDYIAHGGSGFVILRNNNTQLDTGLPMREAVLEKMIRSPRCLEQCRGPEGAISLSDCFVYRSCVEDVDTFLQQFCDQIADTTTGAVSEVTHCALDSQRCEEDADCYKVEIVCADGGCASCNVDGECNREAGERCFDGTCQVDTYRCRDQRCQRACETTADCPGADRVDAAQMLCVRGVCEPDADDVCHDEADCAPGIAHCYGDADPCVVDADCPPATACRGRVCIPAPVNCATDADCATAGLGETFGCALGRCVENARTCTGDADCGGGAECVRGFCTATCQACRDSEGCPSGQVCGDGFCVRPLNVCEEHRCRLACADASDCNAGTQCVEGRCVPTVCLAPQDLETVCRAETFWKAQEQCLLLSCPDADADGRIQRVLPENLEFLPDIYDLDDPEDIDPDLFGGEG